jgi:hypothetical protein
MLMTNELCKEFCHIGESPNEDGPQRPEAADGPSADEEEATNNLNVSFSTPRPRQAMKARNPMWQAVRLDGCHWRG